MGVLKPFTREHKRPRLDRLHQGRTDLAQDPTRQGRRDVRMHRAGGGGGQREGRDGCHEGGAAGNDEGEGDGNSSGSSGNNSSISTPSSMGFSRKSVAPALSAARAVATSLYAVMTTTGTSLPRLVSSA